MSKNENAIKWEKTGLLKHLRLNKKNECADLLESTADILIKKSNGGKNITPRSEMIASTLLPIVRRLYSEKINSMPTAVWLYDDYLVYINSGHNPMDADMNFVPDPENNCCEMYVKNLVVRLSEKKS